MSARPPLYLVVRPTVDERNAEISAERAERNAAREAAMREAMRANRICVRRPWWQRLLARRSTFARALDVHLAGAADLSALR